LLSPATFTAMLYYLHLLLLARIYSLVSILLLRDQEREILLLRQQRLILRRRLSRKPAYGRLEKLAWLLVGLRLAKRRKQTETTGYHSLHRIEALDPWSAAEVFLPSRVLGHSCSDNALVPIPARRPSTEAAHHGSVLGRYADFRK
jgi:hypothetical protein